MDIREAVRKTQQYASYFDFPLSLEEIHHWLVGNQTVSLKTVSQTVGGVVLTGKQQKHRHLLQKYTAKKIKHTQKLASFILHVPGVEMMGITGSVAAGNSKKNDDIDLFFITSPNSLWLVRPLVILIISLFFRRRHPKESHEQAADAFCPNLWMDKNHLSLPVVNRNLYTAHEILQLIPIVDKHHTYEFFLHRNRWCGRYLKNASQSKIKDKYNPKYASKNTFLEQLLAPFNYLLYLLQITYMIPKRTTEFVSPYVAMLHTIDYHSKISKYLK